jgi:hypothetical protein
VNECFCTIFEKYKHFISVFTVSEYRRKFVEQYDSHDLFRADNHEAMEIRKKSSVAALEDAAQWLKEEGNVAVSNIMNLTFRGPHIVVYSYNESQQDALFLRFI